jgi:hypothetical protein
MVETTMSETIFLNISAPCKQNFKRYPELAAEMRSLRQITERADRPLPSHDQGAVKGVEGGFSPLGRRHEREAGLPNRPFRCQDTESRRTGGNIDVDSALNRECILVRITRIAIATMVAYRPITGLVRYGRNSLLAVHGSTAGRRDGDNTAMAAVRWTEIRLGLGNAKAGDCCHQQLDHEMEKDSLHQWGLPLIGTSLAKIYYIVVLAVKGIPRTVPSRALHRRLVFPPLDQVTGHVILPSVMDVNDPVTIKKQARQEQPCGVPALQSGWLSAVVAFCSIETSAPEFPDGRDG